jgi:hypothetical protein
MIIYAHRINTIENSIKSFNNFDGIEFDVRITKDNIPIVIHDYVLDNHNKNIIVHLNTFKYLRKYNIPSLNEILDLVFKYNKKCIIDVKVSIHAQLIINYMKKLVDANIYPSNMFKVLVYNDNIQTYSNIKVLRGYKLKIPKKINTKFYGIAVWYKDNHYSQNNINFFLEKYKTLNINIYPLCKKSNIKFINNIYKKYNSRISITSDYSFKI